MTKATLKRLEAALIRGLRDADKLVDAYEALGVEAAVEVVRDAFAAERKRAQRRNRK